MTGAFGACAYLVARTVRNRAVSQVRRLQSPRYLLPVAVTCAYFFLIFYQPGRDGAEFPVIFPGARRNVAGELELYSACGLALIAAKWWLFGSPHAALDFSGPEVQFLFPAPIRRPMLVLYKIGRTQLSLIIGAVIITVLANRAGAHLPALLRGIAVWMLLCTLTLHQMGATLVRTGAAQRGRGLRRNAIPLVVAGGVLLVLAISAFRAWPGARGVGDVPAAITRVWTALHAPLPYAVLWPFRIAAAPSYAETTRAWFLAIGPAALILALHIVWVLRADAVFEDAAVEASAVRAERRAAERARAAGAAMPTPSMVSKVSGSMAAVRLDRAPQVADSRRTVLPLSPVGDPRVAILWKNILALVRGLRVRTLVLVTISLTVIMLSFRELGLFGDPAPGGGAVLFGALALFAAAFLILLGPLAIRNDLRQDLLHIDMLRTYPLDGASLVFAEVMSSTLALTIVQWVLVTGGYFLLAIAPVTLAGDPLAIFETHFADRTTTLVVFIAVLPIVNAASFVVQNGASLLFPGWVRLGASNMGGFELIGQRILGVAASFTGMAVLMALPVSTMVAALTPWRGTPTGTLLPFFGAVALGSAVAMGEIYLAIQWLGTRFERTDASVILPPS